MPGATVSQQMPVPSAQVFKLLHDYGRRLEWDTLLKEARLTRGHTVSALGATSLCVGKPFFGIFGIETRYVTFYEPHVAAVKMINSPPLFATFAASIRHEDNDQGSTLTYKLHFTAKPRVLRHVIEPIMLRALKLETAKRLRALEEFLGDTKVAT